MKNTKILIVEDEAIIALHIQRILEQRGYIVFGKVTTGEKAIELVREDEPDLILMDIILDGEIDGITTVKEINKNNDIPIIYVTAHSDEQTLEKAKETEPYGYILKPVNNKDLVYAIEIALYKHNIERKLVENEKKYRTLIENLNDIVFSTDEKGEITFISNQVKSIIGYDVSEAIGLPFSQFIFKEDLPLFKEVFDEYKKGLRKSLDCRLITKNGNIKWFRANSRPLFYKNVFLGLKGVLTDITEKKQAEEALLERESDLSEAQRIAKIGGWNWNIKTNEFKMSDEMCRIYGVENHEEFPHINDHLEKRIHPDDRWMIEKGIENLKSGIKEKLLYRIQQPGGNIRWISALPPEVKKLDGDGKPEIVIGTVQDITDQVITEEGLKLSRDRLTFALEASDEGLWDWNLQTNVTYYSPRWFTMMGYEPSELPYSYSTFVNLCHPDDIINVNVVLKNNIEKGEDVFELEYRMRQKNGQWRWFRNKSKVVERDKKGRPLRIVGTNINIHEQKLVHEALKISEERFRAVFESAPVGIILYSPSGRYIRVNHYVCDFLGYKEEELLQLSYMDIINEEDRKIAFNNFKAIVSGKTGTESFEKKYILKNKKLKNAHIRLSLQRDDNNEPEYVIGIIREIKKE